MILNLVLGNCPKLYPSGRNKWLQEKLGSQLKAEHEKQCSSLSSLTAYFKLCLASICVLDKVCPRSSWSSLLISLGYIGLIPYVFKSDFFASTAFGKPLSVQERAMVITFLATAPEPRYKSLEM